MAETNASGRSVSSRANRSARAVDDPDRFQPFNPFTERPVQGVHWDYGEDFGKPVGAAAYTLPRTVQFALGVRS
jgi:hypothetical protein